MREQDIQLETKIVNQFFFQRAVYGPGSPTEATAPFSYFTMIEKGSFEEETDGIAARRRGSSTHFHVFGQRLKHLVGSSGLTCISVGLISDTKSAPSEVLCTGAATSLIKRITGSGKFVSDTRAAILAAQELFDLPRKGIRVEQLPDWIVAAQQMLKDRLENVPTIADLSRELHLHPDYVAKEFALKTGKSISGFVESERVEVAKRLLLISSSNFGQIAAELGFFDQSHFNRAFVRRTGKLPSQFRRDLFDQP